MPAPKRRWFSLSLRTLLIGMTLISVLFGGLFPHHNANVILREAERRHVR